MSKKLGEWKKIVGDFNSGEIDLVTVVVRLFMSEYPTANLFPTVAQAVWDKGDAESFTFGLMISLTAAVCVSFLAKIAGKTLLSDDVPQARIAGLIAFADGMMLDYVKVAGEDDGQKMVYLENLEGLLEFHHLDHPSLNAAVRRKIEETAEYLQSLTELGLGK